MMFSVFIKTLLHGKYDCIMQSVKQHDNLQSAASITSSVGLDKTLAVPVNTLVLKAEWDEGDVRQKSTSKV